MIGALACRKFALSITAATWCALSFAGLVVIYWISVVPIAWHLETSVDRVATTLLLVGGVVLGAFGAGEALRAHRLSRAEHMSLEGPHPPLGSESEDAVAPSPLPSTSTVERAGV